MRNSKALSLSIITRLLFINGALGFASIRSWHFSKHRNQRTFPVKRYVLSDINGEQDAVKKTMAEDVISKEAKAIESLQRLLARQEADIEETKRLLSLYNNAENAEHFDVDRLGNHESTQSDLLSVASSILQGFDYGFQSRSEGASFENLKGGGAEAFNKGYGPPANLLTVGSQQFMRNLNAMRNEYEDEDDIGMFFFVRSIFKIDSKLKRFRA